MKKTDKCDCAYCVQGMPYKCLYVEDDGSTTMSDLITHIRLATGLTQKELAKLAKKKQSSISRAESGRIEPSYSFVYELAMASGVRLAHPKIDNSDTIVIDVDLRHLIKPNQKPL